MASPAPQDRWSQDKHIELVNIIGDLGAGMLTRAMDKELSAALVHECLFVDFLSKEELKKVSEACHARGTKPIFQKQKGIDYDETFAPVARLEAIRIFLAFATYMNFTCYQMDVKSTFLNGKLKEEVYVKQPPGFESNEFPNHVCKLDKALYELKQAPRAWEGLGEGYDGDIAFASTLETFGGGHNDPISVAFGGPVMTKFTIALREIGTYKEVLRSQVEHILNDRLLQFVNIDLHDVKEARKRFDKASLLYDQAREKFLSLRKGTKSDVATVLEEDLHNARATFEQARFNLVTALSNVEAKKRFEFLEAVSGTMDAHLRYFKQGYELLHQMEPYINQVITYAQQSRERSNYEQAALNERMQEYKRQIDRESRWSSSNGSNGSPNGDGIQAIGRSSHKMIEAVMQSASKGKVQTIRQGYLSKRSSNLRGDWKRRFFVLDSRGMLYYYRKQNSKPSGSGSQIAAQRNSSELGHGLLSRWLSSHHHHGGGGVHDEKSVAHHTVNLLTSTIKVDADQSDLRFCFRIISPKKNYTLQAESTLDQMDWIEKITGVIASLLSSQVPERCLSGSPMGSSHHRSASDSSSFESSDFDHTAVEEYASERPSYPNPGRLSRISHHLQSAPKPIDVLRRVCGNDKCADCGASDPDWACLNLGILVCIECSGVHRNLGVHISKVRSLTLDVKVWEPSVITLFQSLGNAFANSVWEELLQSKGAYKTELVPTGLYKPDKPQLLYFCKPSHSDSIPVKEKFIHAKYASKVFVRKPKDHNSLVAQHIWEAVGANDKKSVYRLIVNFEADVNHVYEQGSCNSSLTLAKAMLLQEQQITGEKSSSAVAGTSEGHGYGTEEFDGCTLLHLACETADVGMIELLLQYGANINVFSSRGQTPLHHCILRGKAACAKLLLTRGADPQAANGAGKTAMELAVESNFRDNEGAYGCILGTITGFLCALISAYLIRCIFRYIKTTPILTGPVVFSPHISPKSLESSLSNDNHLQLLGGNYYIILNASLALKKLHPFQIHKHKKTVKRRVQKDLEILASLKHRHLMSLKAYVHHPPDRFCLVYDYVPTGSLEDAVKKMRENELQLGWDARLRIAVGIIKGLQYLHFTCTPSILHYNLKPSNVLLDADFEPRLTDSGLAKLNVNVNVLHTSFDRNGTSSRNHNCYYYAPECFPNFSIYTEKSDIFSFGVILGILLTGKDPSDAIFRGSGSGSGSNSRGDMGMWFRQIVEAGDGRDALDKSLLGEEMEEDEMLMAVRIAAVCLSDMPADRPSSDELVPMLTQLHSF
ncbi:ADP-ribosylation factor GTPase-activating protein AGD3 [Tanacetum coccineum]